MPNPYVILADATANLPERFLSEIDIVKMDITEGEETISYCMDWPEEKVSAFYKKLRAGKSASTSQITPFMYEEAFEKYLSRGEDVLYLCFSSGMSGSFASAETAAAAMREKYPERALEVIDSRCATFSEGMTLMKLIANRKEGMDIRENALWMRENVQSFVSWFTVEDLMYLKRGGRVSSMTAIVGTTLRIMPVMHIDPEGRLTIVDKVQGRKAALKALSKKMKEIWLPDVDKTVLIGHCDAREDAELLKKLVLAAMPEAQIEIGPISPVIGVHSGPGTVAMFFRAAKR